MPGDMYLLFHRLRYDFSEELPLQLGSCVCLDKTPQAWLESSDHGLADYLLPGYSLPGTDLNNSCLRCFMVPHQGQILSQEDYLFLSLLALRMYIPIEIDIGGQFRLGDEGDRILEPTLYEIRSSWNIDKSDYLTPTDLFKASALVERLCAVNRLDLKNLQSGLVFFSHATLGFSKSLQLSYLALFAALEALFVPSNKKAITLS